MYEAFTCQPDPKWSAPISQQPPSPQTTLSTSATKHYDAFGNQTTSTGTWQGPFQYGGNFGYQTDPDSNLKLLGHRYYDPSTGRFLTRDRVQDNRNWYAYCRSDPTAAVDPDGRYDRRIERIIRRNLGNRPADAYKSDPDFRGRVHRRLGKEQIGGPDGKHNPNQSEEAVTDAARDAWGDKPMEARKPIPNDSLQVPLIDPGVPAIPLIDPGVPAIPAASPNWWNIGLGIAAVIVVGGAIIILSGGSSTPVVVAASGLLLGSVALRQ